MTGAPRLELPERNTITRPYRGLSVQEVDTPLTQLGIEQLLSRREIYRRTAFIVLRRNGQTALVAVRPEDPDKLFSPAAESLLLSDPTTTVWIDEPTADVGNASALASTALEHHRDGVLAYVVRGRFEHVNFIWRPAPLTVRVTEVVPPHPPKLLAMAEQVAGYDEDLPPVNLVLDAVDVRNLAAAHPAPHYLLPCRGSGLSASPDVSFLRRSTHLGDALGNHGTGHVGLLRLGDIRRLGVIGRGRRQEQTPAPPSVSVAPERRLTPAHARS